MNEVHDLSSGSAVRASGADPQQDDDLLSDVLRSVRLTGSMLFLVNTTTPWRIWAPHAESFRPLVLPRSQHLVSFHVVTQGHCCAGLPDGPIERFEAGDILVVPHGDPYFLADTSNSEASYGEAEALDFFREMAAGNLPPLVTDGGGGPDSSQFICGFLGCDLRPFNPVLAALPRMIHLRSAATATERLRPLVEFAIGELRERSSGSHEVLLRLAELIFVEVVRRHLESTPHESAGWLAGLHDPLVARALSLLHKAPARRWTLEALAERTGTSRSVLAERFTHFVGMPPMRYLAQWRMQLACRLLTDSAPRKLGAVAEAVGYESEAAFSRAFKRETGVAPGEWRNDRPG